MKSFPKPAGWSQRLNQAIIETKRGKPVIGYKQVAAVLNATGWSVTKNQIRKRYRALSRAGHFELGPQRSRPQDGSVAAGPGGVHPIHPPPGATGAATKRPAQSATPAHAHPSPPVARAAAHVTFPDPFTAPGEDQLPFGSSTLTEDLHAAVSADVERTRRQLHEKEIARWRQRYEALVRRAALEERIVGVYREFLGTLPFAPAVPAPTRPTPGLTSGALAGQDPGGRGVGGSAAVLLISDAHIGQVVDPAQIGGGPGYNPQVYMERLAYLGEQVVATLRRREAVGSRVDELHVFLLGDLLHGHLHHGAEREETMLLIYQITLGLYTLTPFFASLAAAVPTLVVHGADGGNHARWPNQRRPPMVARFSNFDAVLYRSLEHALGLAPVVGNVRFIIGRDPIARATIKGVRFQARHGDTLRGGDKLVGVPVAAIGREVAATALRCHSHGQQSPDYYLVGDKHRATSLSLPTGEFIVNGSFVGQDECSYSYGYPPARPVQVFFGVSARGKTWQEDVDLRFAPARPSPPYPLPADLREAL